MPLIGDDSLNCQKEGNLHDPYAVVIFHNNRTVRHVPENLSECFHRFLTLPRTSIRCTVLGPRVNRGAGYGLEVPVRYHFQGHEKAIAWVKKKVGGKEKEIDTKVSRCLKNAM